MGLRSFLKKLSGYDAIRGALRSDRRFAAKREDSKIQRTVADARSAGIHPLFALGGATGGGSGPYPTTGSALGEGLSTIRKASNLARGKPQPSLVDLALIRSSDAGARASNARAALSEWTLSENKRIEQNSNSSQDVVVPAIDAISQEIKRGQVDPYVKKNPEQSLNVKSIMSKIRIGKQTVWIPIDEIDEFFENPLAIGAATMAYHGNKNVDWKQVMLDYTGKKSISQTMKENIKKHIPVKVRKKHLLKKYAKPIKQMEMP